MLKKCLNLFVTGMILIIIGGIGLAVLFANGLIKSSLNFPVDANGTNAEITIPIEETEEITSLDFSANAGVFTVVQGDNFVIKTYGTAQDVNYNISNGCLKIDCSIDNYLMNFGFSDAAAEIVVTVPERQFKNVTFSLNAGEFRSEKIISDKFTLNFDAGSAEFDNIQAISAAKINMSFGECNFNNSIFNNAEINMDAGEMNFNNCKMTGKNNVNLDFGELNMTLFGKRSDYELIINNDFGEVNVDGAKYSNDKSETSSASSALDINLDFGECNIKFME